MPAALTARRRQQAQSGPAATADNAWLTIVDDAPAAGAGDGKDEIGER
jgi:hypothetical protein